MSGSIQPPTPAPTIATGDSGNIDTTPPGTPATPAVADPGGDEQLGESGLRALKAEREAHKAAKGQIADLQSQIGTLTTQLSSAANAGLPEWEQRVNDLQAKLDGEISARAQAEKVAQDAQLLQLRTDCAIGKGLSATASRKLAMSITGTTTDEINTEIDEWLPLMNPTGVTMTPNPQQGVPSQGQGGSISAGRERFAAQHK